MVPALGEFFAVGNFGLIPEMGVRTDCWRVFYECFVFFGAAA